MTTWIVLAWRSAWHRRFALSLVVACVALASALLVGLAQLRDEARAAFSRSVSGTDLIVGARGGEVQLLLYAVFRLGSATRTIRWSSVQALQADPEVDWVLPLSLGDSHRGFPVVATVPAYFERFRHGLGEPLRLVQGRPFGDGPDAVFEAVLGAEVAARLGLGVGASMTLAHGAGEIEALDHADKPFRVVGVLARTGTPVDRSVHISLQGMEALHLDWMAGVPLPGLRLDAEQARQRSLQPKAVTAALVGLKRRTAVFAMQRRVAAFEAEPLMAVLPGVALDQLWQAVGLGEQLLQGMAALVAAVSLAGLVAVVVAGLELRRRELAVLRAVGAGPRQLLGLLLLEGMLVATLGAALGALGWAALAALAGPWAQSVFGLALQPAWPSTAQWGWLGAVVGAGTLASGLPAWRAYRLSLADGLTPRA